MVHFLGMGPVFLGALRGSLANYHSNYSPSTIGCYLRRFLLFVLFYVLFVCKCVLPSGDNTIAVNEYIISYQLL